MKSWLAVLIAAAPLLVAGCGDGTSAYPVTGRVALPGGLPLVGAKVTFKSTVGDATVRPRGQTDENGHYRVRLNETHQGAPPGSYQITVTEALGDDVDARPKPKIHLRYASFEKSGLQFTVEQASNTFDIEVDPPQGK